MTMIATNERVWDEDADIEMLVPETESSNAPKGLWNEKRDISWLVPSSAKHQNPVVKQHRKTIPSEICFQSSSSSSPSSLSIQSDLDLEARPQICRSIQCNLDEDQRHRDFHNKWICLELLESERFDDNCVGMEHLVSMANRELVNISWSVSSDTMGSTKSHSDGSLFESSIAYFLVCNIKFSNSSSSSDQKSEEFSKRLRAIFPSFLCESQRKRRCGNAEHKNFDTDSTASLRSSLSTQSFSPSCSSSTASSDKMIRSQTEEISKTSLKLPALRILVSSLELVSRTRSIACRGKSASSSSSSSFTSSMNLENWFWRSILAYMTACLQDLVVMPARGAEDEWSERPHCNQTSGSPQQQHQRDATKDGIQSYRSIEATLVVKGVRLLYKLQPELMGPYVRHSLLPFVSSTLEFGSKQHQHLQQQRQLCHKPIRGNYHRRRSSSGDKMLVKECERLLREFP